MSEEFEQKKEFLQREEVKTMQKDIAKLREAEAQKERERVANLKLGEKIATKQPIEQEINEVETKPVIDILVPKSPPKKFGSFKKILVRTAVVFASFLVLGYLVWFFIIKKPLPEPLPKPPLPEQVIDQEPVTPEPEPEPEPKPEPEPDKSILPTIIERPINWGHHFPPIPRTIDTIIIHSVYNALGKDVHNIEEIIQQYRKYNEVTGHYLIARDGAVLRLVPDKAIAYHAGVSRMPDNSRISVVNNFSIGIGIINTQAESPTEIQYQSLAQLVKVLRQEYNIPFENILGHKAVAFDRNRETGPWNFDWKKFNQMIK